MAKVLTRSDFYDLVWSKPMTHLAKDLGVSDATLHKVCKKHDIPKPPAGWWTRKALGQDLTTPPIPPAKPGCADRITIATGVGGIEPSLIAAARERARTIASEEAENVPQLHPIVERTLAQLRKVKPLGIGTVATGGAGRIKAEIAPGSVIASAIS